MKKLLLMFFFSCIYLNVNSQIIQKDWRWRNDDAGETAATWKAGVNESITLKSRDTLRLRIAYVVRGAQYFWPMLISGTNQSSFNEWIYPSGWSNTAPFAVAQSAHFAHGDTTTAQIASGNYVYIPGKMASDYFYNASNVEGPASGYKALENEWNIMPTKFTKKGTYYFNMYNSYTSNQYPTFEGLPNTSTVPYLVYAPFAGDINTVKTSPTNSAVIPFTVDFDEDVTGLTLSDFIISNGTASNLSGSGKNYTVDVAPAWDGEVVVELADSAVINLTGDASISSASRITYDSTPPSFEGVVEGKAYKAAKITFWEGTATLNGQHYQSDTYIQTDGTYTFHIKDEAGNDTTVNFTVTRPVANVWNEPVMTFTKAANADYNQAVNQDRITDLVWLTRGNQQGPVNAKLDSYFSHGVSPTNTEWSFGELADYETLTYRSWYYAVYPPASMTGRKIVVHLIEENIYFGLEFTSWTQGSNQGGPGGGGFSYKRTTGLPQTITFNALDTVAYGSPDIVLDTLASSTGLLVSYASDNHSVATIVDGKIHITGVGTANITASRLGIGAYGSAQDVVQPLTVTRKDITLTLNAEPAISKNYDGSKQTSLSSENYKLSGIESTEYVWVSGNALFDNKNAGSDKTITVTDFVLDGQHAGNYNLLTDTARTTGTITTRYLGVSLNSSPLITKVYDGSSSVTLDSANYVFDGFVEGDSLEVSSTATFHDKNVGTDKSLYAGDFVLSGADKGNYVVYNSSADAVGSVTPKEVSLTVSPSPAISRAYNGTTSVTLSNDNYVFTGLESSDEVTATSTAMFDTKHNGTNKVISVTNLALGGAQKDNYTLTTVSDTTRGTITPKVLTAGLNASPAITKAYDGTTNATLLAANYSLPEIVSGDEVTVSGIPAYTNKNGGTGKTITASALVLAGANASDYSLSATSASTTGTITTLALTVTADNKNKFQGTANPVFTLAYSGFLNGEDENSLSTKPTATTTATLSSAIGNYPITPSGGVSANYSFTYVAGTLTVKPGAPTSVSLASATVFENQAAGTSAGALSSTSDDSGATFTYSLVSGSGDTDNALFSISGNQLLTAASLNFEQKTVYNLRLRSTTQHNLFLDKQVSITINDVNEAPTISSVANAVICYTPSEQTIGLSGISSGPEAGQTTAVSVSTNNSALFESLSVSQATNGNAVLRYVPSPGANGAATVTLLIQDNGGTANGGVNVTSISFTVTMNALPVVSLSSDRGLELSKGETAVITANSNGTYQWATASGIISGQNSANLTVRPSETTTYRVVVTNAAGCTKEEQITIAVKADFMAVKGTNIMSPNGDGVNDRLIIKNLDMYPKNEVKIFDKGGRLIYSQKNYTDQWDGTLNGASLAQDTYYYIVDFGPGIQPLKGFISIIKD